jgi:hypothetical protein
MRVLVLAKESEQSGPATAPTAEAMAEFQKWETVTASPAQSPRA